MGETFNLLIVCHANLCRSPMAERLARRTFTERLGSSGSCLAVSSAGTHAEPDQPMHPLTAQTLLELGADTRGFSSRPVTSRLLLGADLILTAERQQRARCVAEAPSTVLRTFTLRQFGRLITVVDGNRLVGRSPELRLAELTREMAIARSRLPSPSEADDNLADPVNQPLQAFRSCAAQIRHVLELMIDRIRVGH